MSRRQGAAGLLATALTAAINAAPAAASAQPAVQIDEPRAYGHVVGDLIEREARFELPAGRQVAADSLPRPGRAGNWLELRQVAPEQRDGRFVLHLTYQLINAPQKVTTIALPALTLRLAGEPAAALTPLGEWPLTVAPLTPEFVLARAGLEAMQPDIVPSPEPIAPIAGRLVLWGALLAAALYALALRRWPQLAFWRRDAPFRDALADLRRLSRRGGDAAHREALQRLHAAFDASAGRALFSERLAPLYAARPQFVPLAQRIEAFYAASRRTFFAAGEAPPAPDFERLIALCRALAQREGAR